MPIRSCSTKGALYATDLPILPFLGPQVFGLWPNYTLYRWQAALPQRMRGASSSALRTGSREDTGRFRETIIRQDARSSPRLRYSSSVTAPKATDGSGNLLPTTTPRENSESSNLVESGISSSNHSFGLLGRSSQQWSSRRQPGSGFRTPLTSENIRLLEAQQSINDIDPIHDSKISPANTKHSPEGLRAAYAASYNAKTSDSEMPQTSIATSGAYDYNEIDGPRLLRCSKTRRVYSVPGNATPRLGDLECRPKGNQVRPQMSRWNQRRRKPGQLLKNEVIQRSDSTRIHSWQTHRSRQQRFAPFKRLCFSATQHHWDTIYLVLYKAKLLHRPHDVDSRLHPEVTEWLSELTRDGNEVSSMRGRWRNLTLEQTSMRRQHILLWSLANSPHDVPALLEATTTSTAAHLPLVCACFFYLDKFFPDKKLLDRYDSATGTSLVFNYLDPSRTGGWHLQPRSLNVLLKYCTDSETRRVFDVLKKRSEQKIPVNAALFLMGRFTAAGNLEYAVMVLEHLSTRGVNLSMERVLSRCTTLLKRCSELAPDATSVSSSILTRTLRAGVEPNLILNNVILSNAFESEGSDTGWKVFKHLLSHGFKPDAIAYVTLIQDAINRSDQVLLDDLLSQILGHKELAMNEILLSCCIHAVYRINLNNHPQAKTNLIRLLFPMFARLHDIQPLKDLHVIPDNWSVPPGAMSATRPHPPSLGIMAAAFLNSQTDPEAVVTLYHRFRGLVLERHPAVFNLALTDYTYNAFLMALYRHASYLPQCIRILEDMLAPLPPNSVLSDSRQESILDRSPSESPCPRDHKDESLQTSSHCKPTIITWNILLLAFMYHNQPASAEKIRNMMLKRGVRFNMRCWAIWVRGHAGMHMGEKALNALDEMEREGFFFGVEEWRKQKGGKGLKMLEKLLQHWGHVKEERARAWQWEDKAQDEKNETINKGLDVDLDEDGATVGNALLGWRPLLDKNERTVTIDNADTNRVGR
jgi:hypothetical protein